MTSSRIQQLDALRAAMKKESANTGVVKDSEGFYQLLKSADGNGYAIIRFLPPLPNENFPFVQTYNHAFPGSGKKWFIEDCPTTLERPCPICEANALLYKSGVEADKKTASLRKRKMYYVSNVFIIKDPKEPTNEGKVLFFKYGVKIMAKLQELVDPSFGDEPTDPFSTEEGSNFRLRMVRTGGFPDYGKSSFDPPSKLGEEDEVKRILAGRRSLAAIIAPKEFKSYDDLKKKFEQIVGPLHPVAETAVTPPLATETTAPR